MSIRLRVKGPTGQSKTVTCDADETILMFCERMKDLFGAHKKLEILSGFPPQVCDADEAQLIGSIMKSGDSLTLREFRAPLDQSDTFVANIKKGNTVYYKGPSGGVDMIEILKVHPGEPAIPESYTAIVRNSSDKERIGRELNVQYMSDKIIIQCPQGQDKVKVPGDSRLSNDLSNSMTWDCTVCTFKNTNTKECDMCGTSRLCLENVHNTVANDGGGRSARRYRIPDDNSCLFHAYIFLLQRTESPQELRNKIAQTVSENPTQWNDAMLGRSCRDYIQFITDSTKWGGQVELNILCSMARVEIATVDIQSGRMDVYGQGENFVDRVYMLFSGIHFDAVTFDIQNSIRKVKSDDFDAERNVLVLASELRSQGAYTDNTTMRLVCQICGHEMTGDYEARLHAGASGHTDFKMKSSF